MPVLLWMSLGRAEYREVSRGLMNKVQSLRGEHVEAGVNGYSCWFSAAARPLWNLSTFKKIKVNTVGLWSVGVERTQIHEAILVRKAL